MHNAATDEQPIKGPVYLPSLIIDFEYRRSWFDHFLVIVNQVDARIKEERERAKHCLDSVTEDEIVKVRASAYRKAFYDRDNQQYAKCLFLGHEALSSFNQSFAEIFLFGKVRKDLNPHFLLCPWTVSVAGIALVQQSQGSGLGTGPCQLNVREAQYMSYLACAITDLWVDGSCVAQS